jgi:hypothetical protein
MNQVFDFVVIAILFFTTFANHVMHKTSNQQKVDSISYYSKDTCPLVEVIDTCIIDSIGRIVSYTDSVTVSDTIHHKEWFPFANKKYNYEPIVATEDERNHFANILYRESGNAAVFKGHGFQIGKWGDTIPLSSLEVDQYFVALVGIRTIHATKHPYDKCQTLSDMFYNGQFTPENSIPHWDNIHWRQCRKVVDNVLACKIPTHIPYLPQGTFCYWNSRIDTNVKQKRYLETQGIHVATTIKDHHYFVIVHYADPEEIGYLLNYGACSEVTKHGPKQIKNGILCDRSGKYSPKCTEFIVEAEEYAQSMHSLSMK